MQEIKVRNVIIGKQFENSGNLQEFLKIAKEKNSKVKIVEAGERINIERYLYIDVLWPDSQNIIDENILNNNSLVCKMSYRDFSILFTGDIEEIAEKAILKKYKRNISILNVTVLKVAHHGSKTSSIVEFLEEVKPEIALIGVGKNNKFGHPAQEVIEKLKNKNTQIFRTDEMGEINIVVNKKGKIKIKPTISD